MRGDEFSSIGEREVSVVEAGCNGATHQRPLAAADKLAALPYTGRHDELVNRGGLYQRLYELQFVTSDVNPE